jgi:hypothetical protein
LARGCASNNKKITTGKALPSKVLCWPTNKYVAGSQAFLLQVSHGLLTEQISKLSNSICFESFRNNNELKSMHIASLCLRVTYYDGICSSWCLSINCTVPAYKFFQLAAGTRKGTVNPIAATALMVDAGISQFTCVAILNQYQQNPNANVEKATTPGEGKLAAHIDTAMKMLYTIKRPTLPNTCLWSSCRPRQLALFQASSSEDSTKCASTTAAASNSDASRYCMNAADFHSPARNISQSDLPRTNIS